MKRFNWDNKSIVFRLTFMTVIIVIGQAALLSLFLILGGVLSQAEQNAYQSFSDKVNTRKSYLQNEIKYNWTNLSSHTQQISDLYSDDKDPDQFLEDISTSLISMLRSTQATGAFVILNDSSSEKPALYIRDYDPNLNDYGKSDLYLVYGPSNLANDHQIPLDQTWKYRINLGTIPSAFYEKPFSKASLSTDASLLGYWSLPFKLAPEDISIITYSIPLLDKHNQVIGVIGVEISEQHLSKFLPATDLQNKDAYGYMLGFRPPNDDKVKAIVLTKSIQKRFVEKNEYLDYSIIDPQNSIYLLKSEHTKLYLAVEDLGLYSINTPFQDNRWYLIGIMNENVLLSYVLRIKSILLVSFIASVLIGVVVGYLSSYVFTKPITEIAQKVKETNYDNAIELQHTGLSEVDKMLDIIQSTSNMLLEASGNMSRIIEMVGLPLGVFEYRDQSDEVFITDQIPRLLSLNDPEASNIIKNKPMFKALIQNLLSKPEDGEEDIYLVDQAPPKWLKIKQTYNDSSTIGVIIDMTDEMVEKRKILIDRDLDSLTGIYNRKAMQTQMEEALEKRDQKLNTAMIMFDLDNLKAINDAYGHKWGDIYIKQAVRYLSEICQDHQILGRRSGDEFTILLYNCSTKDDVRKCLDKFYRDLSYNQITYPDGKKKPVSISAGLIWIDSSASSFDEYLQQADELLYEAKRYKKGCYFEATAKELVSNT